jgi:hypothetical protein
MRGSGLDIGYPSAFLFGWHIPLLVSH